MQLRLPLAATALLVVTAMGDARGERTPVDLSGSASLSGTLALSLADAIAMGLENNLDIEIERHAPLIAEENYRISWGAYDPILGGDAGYDESKPTTGNPLTSTGGQTSTGIDGNVGLTGTVPYLGATYDVNFFGDKTESSSFINTFNPEYSSRLRFSGSLPVLRGLVWNQAWTGIKTSGALRGETTENFRSNVMRVVQEIETKYWNLIAEREQLAVAHKSLETAMALLGQVQTQYEVGVVSRVEVVEAEAGVAERDFSLIISENQYRSAQDDLIDVVLGPHLTAASSLEVQPSEEPEAYSVYEIDVPKAVEIAFTLRPELRAAEYEVERGELELRFRRNERLPQLDVQGSYGLEGLSGRNGINSFTGAPIPPNGDAAAGPDFADATHAFGRGNGGDSWDVRALVSIPIGNISGRHGVSRAQLELRRAETRLTRTRQQIILEVRKSARDLLSGLRGIEAAERRRLAAAEQLRAERVRLEHGESTPFEVLQRESDLVDAESQKINALQTYRNSEAALLRAQGTILDARNVLFEEAAALR